MRSKLVDRGSEAVDQLTRAIAKCAERAYAYSPDSLKSEDILSAARVHIAELQVIQYIQI